MSQSCALSQAPGREFISCLSPSFWCFAAIFDVSWFVVTSRQSLLLVSNGLLCLCFPFPSHRIRIHHNPLWTHPNWITSAKTLPLNKIPFTGSRGRNSHIFWEEHNTTHNWDCELELVSITILNCHAVWDFRNDICLIFYRHVRNRISWLMKCF